MIEYYDNITEGTARRVKFDKSIKYTLKTFIWWIFTFILCAIAFGTVFFSLASIFNVNKVHILGESMEDTFQDGDIAYLWTRDDKPQRDDITVFTPPNTWGISAPEHNADQQLFVKRTIAIPNDTLQIKDSKVIVNNKIILDAEKYGIQCNQDSKEYTLDNHEYFVMGDNTGVSNDAFLQYCYGEKSDFDNVLIEDSDIAVYGKKLFSIKMPFKLS